MDRFLASNGQTHDPQLRGVPEVGPPLDAESEADYRARQAEAQRIANRFDELVKGTGYKEITEADAGIVKIFRDCGNTLKDAGFDTLAHEFFAQMRAISDQMEARRNAVYAQIAAEMKQETK